VCGLVAWLIGRRAARAERLMLALGVIAIVGVTAGSRVIVNAHWVSDVTGGVCVGAVWLGVILLVMSRIGSPPSVPEKGEC
jgi:membrane-associated phospholipid phosphatase